MEKTHIEITKGTRRRLRVWKAERDMTYDEAINTLLDLGDMAVERAVDGYDESGVESRIGRLPEPEPLADPVISPEEVLSGGLPLDDKDDD